jgi:hypothetical protein
VEGAGLGIEEGVHEGKLVGKLDGFEVDIVGV